MPAIKLTRQAVERSSDGKTFEAIGQIKATNMSQTRTYNFDDNAPLSTISYYRLRMVDNDGTFKYSPLVTLTLAPQNGWKMLSVYPNPTKEVAYLDIESDNSRSLTVLILDVTGREQSRKQWSLERGLNKITLSNLPKGTSLVQLVDDKGRVQTQQLTRQD